MASARVRGQSSKRTLFFEEPFNLLVFSQSRLIMDFRPENMAVCCDGTTIGLRKIFMVVLLYSMMFTKGKENFNVN